MSDLAGNDHADTVDANGHAEGHRSFQIRKRNTNGQVRTLDINGQVFRFYPDRIPAMILTDLPGMRVNMNSQPMWDLFEAVMPDDYERFRRMLRSPELEWEADEIKGVLDYIVREAAERPTTPSSR